MVCWAVLCGNGLNAGCTRENSGPCVKVCYGVRGICCLLLISGFKVRILVHPPTNSDAKQRLIDLPWLSSKQRVSFRKRAATLIVWVSPNVIAAKRVADPAYWQANCSSGRLPVLTIWIAMKLGPVEHPARGAVSANRMRHWRSSTVHRRHKGRPRSAS